MPVHPAYPAELIRRQIDDDEQMAAAWVDGAVPPTDPILIVDPDPAWPHRFAEHAGSIAGALGEIAVRIEHVGSTSVPGLPAKPIIDIDVHVREAGDESSYVPLLQELGYQLLLREPWWNSHRMLVTTGPASRVNLHVFPADAPEPLRHLLFRDWLRTHPADRDRYAAVKRELAAATAAAPIDYNMAKNEVIDDIFESIFAAPPSAHPSWPQQQAGS